MMRPSICYLQLLGTSFLSEIACHVHATRSHVGWSKFCFVIGHSVFCTFTCSPTARDQLIDHATSWIGNRYKKKITWADQSDCLSKPAQPRSQQMTQLVSQTGLEVYVPRILLDIQSFAHLSALQQLEIS